MIRTIEVKKYHLINQSNTSSKQNLFLTFIITLVVVVMFNNNNVIASSTGGKYDGSYTLLGVFDSKQGTELILPANNKFEMVLHYVSDDTYKVGCKIGNAISTTMTVKPDDTTVKASFGHVMSTRMLPPPEIYQIENVVMDIFSTETTISSSSSLVDNDTEASTILTIENTNSLSKMQWKLV